VQKLIDREGIVTNPVNDLTFKHCGVVVLLCIFEVFNSILNIHSNICGFNQHLQTDSAEHIFFLYAVSAVTSWIP